MPAVHSENLYDRLGVGRTSSREEVRRAYRALLRQYPPERAPEEFKRIREAYETLNDARSRAEYDSAPSASVQRALQLASAAMEKESYYEAEQHLKRALVEDPNLDFARSWLGLCFLYQEKAEQAVGQFERLLQRPDPAAHWFGNAGHAYRMVGRSAEAERMFRRAVVMGIAQGDDVSGFYIGLASLYIDQEDYSAAESILEQAIRHDGQVDFEDMQFFAKLLDVQLHRRDLDRARHVLQRIESVAKGEDERFHAALKLGVLARKLVSVGAFSFAVPISNACLRLQPKDADYQGLSKVATLLEQRKVGEVSALVDQHPSFRDGNWLSHLTPAVREHCTELRIFAEMKPIHRAPSLRTFNTIGTHLYGKRDYDPKTESFVATLFFVVLFIPIFPLACYRVIERGENSWSFLGKVPFSDGEKKHLAFAIVALLVLVFYDWGSANSTPDSSPATATATPEAIVPNYPPVLSNGAANTSSAGQDGGVEAISEGANAEDLDGGYDATVDAPVSDAPVYDEGPSAAHLRDQIEAERARIAGMENQLRQLRQELSASSDEIDRIAADTERIERSAGPDGIPPDEYDGYRRLVAQVNAMVTEHNAKNARHNRMQAEYKAAIDELNRKVDEYNSLQ